VLPNGFIGNIIVYGVRFEGGVVSGSILREALSSTFGSAAPPQNHPRPGQDQLNNQHLIRHKRPQRWRRLHPLLGGWPTAVADQHNLQDERPLPATPLSPTQPPRFDRALIGHDLRPARPLPTTATCRINGRNPQHLSQQRNHLTSATL
jgi:hypothetical protein